MTPGQHSYLGPAENRNDVDAEILGVAPQGARLDAALAQFQPALGVDSSLTVRKHRIGEADGRHDRLHDGRGAILRSKQPPAA